MRSDDAFSSYHPLVSFLYFCLIFGFSMFSMHPVCLGISAAGAVVYCRRLKSGKATGLLLKGVLPLFLLAVIINPAFSHDGMTVLGYLPRGNPLTLESILYGLGAGVMLASILLWFVCFSEVVTSDKFIYLFGRAIPALSLLLSMTLRFVPRFKAQFDAVREVQASLGRDMSRGSVVQRVKSAVACFSIVVTWSMENAIETADSMKSRGYGMGRRSAYSIYRMEERDKTALAFLLFCALFLLCGALAGGASWRYYPTVRGALTGPITILMETVFLFLCFMPEYIDRKEEAAWRSSVSSI